MNRDHQQRIEDLFHAALDRPPIEWDAFLADACDDDEVRRNVRALLDEDAAAATWFAGLAGRAGALQRSMQPDLEVGALTGRRVGPYVLEEEVGRGGTSVVYAARRVDGSFERTVAVKVLTRGSGGADLRERFEREQQVLSGLSHPNIAALYDGGVTEDGYPYFVMELVDGLPLDRYCDDRRLTVVERLLVIQTDHAGSLDLYTMPADGSAEWRPYLRADRDDLLPRVSPDGRWLAYESHQRGERAISVRSFPEPGRAVLVSEPGVPAVEPVWSPDGATVYYRQMPSEEVVAADVTTSPEFEVIGRRIVGRVSGPLRDVHPSGQWLLGFRFGLGEGGDGDARMIGVVNWFSELAERLGGR